MALRTLTARLICPREMGSNMIDEATLATMIGAFLWLVYHCREWKVQRSELTQWMDARFEAFAVTAGDVQEILEDIVEGLGAAAPPSGSAHPPSGIGEMLTGLLMSNMNIGSKHGANERRAVQETEQHQTQTETEDERDEHSGIISGG